MKSGSKQEAEDMDGRKASGLEDDGQCEAVLPRLRSTKKRTVGKYKPSRHSR
jgi:hypothetical protein